MAWDPSAPNTIGIDWSVTGEAAVPLTTPATCLAFLCASGTTETISTVYVPHTWDGPSTGYGKMLLEIYDVADAGAGQSLTTSRYQPNQDTTANNMFGTPGGWTSLSAGSVYTKLDEVTYDDTDYIWLAATSYDRMAFNTVGFGASQVSSVTFELRVQGFGGASLGVDLYDNTTFKSRLATITPPAGGSDNPTQFQTYTIGPLTTNPATGAAWTSTEIANMDSGTNLLIQLTHLSASGAVGLSWFSMVVVAGTDKRKAWGSTATQTSKPVGTQTNIAITLAANWSKLTATNYLFILRRIDDPAGIATALIPQPFALSSTVVTPNGDGQSYSSTIDSGGVLQTVGSAVPTRTVPYWLGTNAGAISADSMPYWDLVLKPVYTGIGNVRQGINGASAQTYKGVRLILGVSGTPTANLTVMVKRTSDNVQMGGTATITTTDLAAGTVLGTITDATYGTITIYSLLANLASSATLAAAVNYYFDFASSTSSGNPWLLLMLDATASHSLTGNQTYGGSTNQATAAGSAVAQGDFIAALQSAVVEPSSITVTATNTTINSTALQYADIDWVDGGVLGGTFSRWEVERSEDSGTTWTAIAYIATEGTLTFADYEALRGSATLKYRVRKRRTDGAVSDWRTQSGTTTLAATTGVTIFTSNATPSATVGYVVFGESASYQFLSADETVHMKLHNRNYQASFKSLEQRGLSWQFEVGIHGGPAAPAAGEGVQTFALLRNLAESTTITTVCMITGDGERFFGTVQVSRGDRHQPSKIYTAPVIFTQTSATSALVSV